jgi:hypothetical protein
LSKNADWSISGLQNYAWFGSSFGFIKSKGIVVVGAPGYRVNENESKTNGRIYGFKIEPKTKRAVNHFSITSDIDKAQFGKRLLIGDFYMNGSMSLLVASPTEVFTWIIYRLPM